MATSEGVAVTQMGGNLPASLVTGRSNQAGPITGGYVSFGLTGFTNTENSLTDEIVYSIEMPMDFRVEAISYANRTEVGATSFMVAQGTTLAWAGAETDMISATVALVSDTGDLLVATGTPKLVAAARNVAKGAFLMIAVTSDGTGTFLDLNVQIIGYARGHINADPADD